MTAHRQRRMNLSKWFCAAAAQPFSANPEPELNTGFEVRIDASAVAAWAFARGVDVYDYENNQFTYNTPELQEALALLAQAVNDGCMAQVAEQYGDQNDFGAGKTLFYQGFNIRFAIRPFRS